MPGERINVERVIVVPEEPDEVWESLTDPARLEEWFASDVELDARPGGEGVFRWGDGEDRRVVVRELEEDRRLVLDWDDGGTVAIELEPVVDGTRVHVIESSPEFAPAFELRSMAWTALAAQTASSPRWVTRVAARSSRQWRRAARRPLPSSRPSCRSRARRSRSSSL